MTAARPYPKLTITNGAPVTVALKYPAGKRVSSRIPNSPDQQYYSLTDGRSMYLPLQVGHMIDELKLKPGEPFTILKRGPGDWSVEKGGGPQAESESAHKEVRQPHSTPVNGQGEAASDILNRCYRNAVEISLEAVEFARQKGLMVTPSFEDLRAISATLLITEVRR